MKIFPFSILIHQRMCFSFKMFRLLSFYYFKISLSRILFILRYILKCGKVVFVTGNIAHEIFFYKAATDSSLILCVRGISRWVGKQGTGSIKQFNCGICHRNIV